METVETIRKNYAKQFKRLLYASLIILAVIIAVTNKVNNTNNSLSMNTGNPRVPAILEHTPAISFESAFSLTHILLIVPCIALPPLKNCIYVLSMMNISPEA